MKSRIGVSALLVAAFLAAHTLWAASQTPVFDVKCPVSGKPVKNGPSLDFNGGKVYFCCNNCPKAFKKDEAKYAAKANLQLVETGQLVQVACPLTGKPVNPATEITVEGVKVSFCCNNCKSKATAVSGDEQIQLIFGDTAKGFKPVGDVDG